MISGEKQVDMKYQDAFNHLTLSIWVGQSTECYKICFPPDLKAKKLVSAGWQ